jgi:hypothetical protein
VSFSQCKKNPPASRKRGSWIILKGIKMNRMELYNILKEMLAKNGAIPETEQQYNSLINDLLDIICSIIR